MRATIVRSTRQTWVQDAAYSEKQFAFVRWNDDERLIVVSNFDPDASYDFRLRLPESVVDAWQLDDGEYEMHEQLYGEDMQALAVRDGRGKVRRQTRTVGVAGAAGRQAPVNTAGEKMRAIKSQFLVILFVVALAACSDGEPWDEYMDDWRNSGVLGTLVYWRDVESEFLAEKRNVEIWLPPGYDDDPERRYPVIYMHDGQNLFDPRIANTGIDWGVDEAIMRGVDRGAHEAAIVVGAWSSNQRTREYSPWHDAPRYARFLIEEIMPRVNAEFRTRTDRDNTFVMGSSMGGLLSYYLVMNHSDVFSACGCVSTHVPFSQGMYSKSCWR